MAIYALATLFNRHKPPAIAGAGDAALLEVLWAPVLLIHLGGQHFITAYSIEDSELWRRHLVTLVSQLTRLPSTSSASLGPAEVAILLFVVGILKFIRRPWSLENASIDNEKKETD
nr:unnamed protein product [Digitaria exilis]